MSEPSDVITRMAKALNCGTEYKLLKKLNLSDSTAAAWKRRGRVPDIHLIRVSELSGYSVKWLKTGEDDKLGDNIEAMAMSKLGRNQNEKMMISWLEENRPDLRERLTTYITSMYVSARHEKDQRK